MRSQNSQSHFQFYIGSGIRSVQEGTRGMGGWLVEEIVRSLGQIKHIFFTNTLTPWQEPPEGTQAHVNIHALHRQAQHHIGWPTGSSK